MNSCAVTQSVLLDIDLLLGRPVCLPRELILWVIILLSPVLHVFLVILFLLLFVTCLSIVQLQWINSCDSHEYVTAMMSKLREDAGDDPARKVACDAVETCLRASATDGVKVGLLSDCNHSLKVRRLREVADDSAFLFSMDVDTIVLVMDTLGFLNRLQFLPMLSHNWYV